MKNIVMHWVQRIVVGIIIATFLPLGLMWSMNILFGLDLVFNLENWAAAFVLCFISGWIARP